MGLARGFSCGETEGPERAATWSAIREVHQTAVQTEGQPRPLRRCRTMRTHCVNLVAQTVLLSCKRRGGDAGYIQAAVVILVTCKQRGRSAYQRPCLSFMFEIQWCRMFSLTYPDTRIGHMRTHTHTHTHSHTDTHTHTHTCMDACTKPQPHTRMDARARA